MNNPQFNNQQNFYNQQNSEQQYYYKMGYDNATAELKKKDKRRKICNIRLNKRHSKKRQNPTNIKYSNIKWGRDRQRSI